jgi:hypothetical protein
MRVASRHMPKFVPRPLGATGRLVLAVLLAGVVYVAVAEPKVFLLFSGVLASLFWYASLQSKRRERKLRALASEREGQTICEFARDFDTRAVDTWIIRAVYEQLQGQLKHVHPAFPVRADDRLMEDLLLDDEALDMEVVQEVEARTGRLVDDSASNPYFGRVRTVRDFVLFFQAQPKSSGAT